MSDKDVDAQFADIVAHWDDLPTLPDRTLPAEAVDSSDSAADRPVDSATERAAVDEPPTLRPNPVNPPPTGPFVVWRGADQSPAEDHPEPAELRDAGASAVYEDTLALLAALNGSPLAPLL